MPEQPLPCLLPPQAPRFKPDSMSVVIQGLLKLTPLLENVAKVGVGLGKQRVLLDGQRAEVGRS